MALSAGTRLCRYEIVAPVGGRDEIYLAIGGSWARPGGIDDSRFPHCHQVD